MMLIMIDWIVEILEVYFGCRNWLDESGSSGDPNKGKQAHIRANKLSKPSQKINTYITF